MIVKICGITRPEDAVAAVELGAQALGFIFWPESPRFIDPHRARRIVAGLPPFVTTVGVFVNQSAPHVNAVANVAGMSAVQLHGDETPAAIAEVNRPVLKALAIGPAFVPESLDAWPAHAMILLDVHDPAARGGTGRTIDWQQAAAAARRRRVVLAGGLTPENVGGAIDAVRPFGIDVSSGVESRPGIKDHARLRALFEAMHAHDHSAPRP